MIGKVENFTDGCQMTFQVNMEGWIMEFHVAESEWHLAATMDGKDWHVQASINDDDWSLPAEIGHFTDWKLSFQMQEDDSWDMQANRGDLNWSASCYSNITGGKTLYGNMGSNNFNIQTATMSGMSNHTLTTVESNMGCFGDFLNMEIQGNHNNEKINLAWQNDNTIEFSEPLPVPKEPEFPSIPSPIPISPDLKVVDDTHLADDIFVNDINNSDSSRFPVPTGA